MHLFFVLAQGTIDPLNIWNSGKKLPVCIIHDLYLCMCAQVQASVHNIGHQMPNSWTNCKCVSIIYGVCCSFSLFPFSWNEESWIDGESESKSKVTGVSSLKKTSAKVHLMFLWHHSLIHQTGVRSPDHMRESDERGDMNKEC